MHNIEYQHKVSPSFLSKLIQAVMGLLGIKRKMERRMITNGFAKEPARIPNSILRNFNILEIDQSGRKVWTISPKSSQSDVVILYLHGGAYMSNINKQHWNLIEQLAMQTSAAIVVPDYPLTPEASCKETYDFMQVSYTRLISDYPSKRIVFIGDSAGGGLALGFAQQLRDGSKKQPDEIIVFSPWLDLTMSNPNLEIIDKEDKILSIEGLKNAGLKYAGNLDLKDYRVSPIYGDLTGICRISIFTGTKDLLNADAQKCKQLMKNQNVSFNYFEYPALFHDWVIITSLKESCDVIKKVDYIVNDQE